MENFELNISTSKKRSECDMCNYNNYNDTISKYYIYKDTLNNKNDIYRLALVQLKMTIWDH